MRRIIKKYNGGGPIIPGLSESANVAAISNMSGLNAASIANTIPSIAASTTIKKAANQITSNGLGTTLKNLGQKIGGSVTEGLANLGKDLTKSFGVNMDAFKGVKGLSGGLGAIGASGIGGLAATGLGLLDKTKTRYTGNAALGMVESAAQMLPGSWASQIGGSLGNMLGGAKKERIKTSGDAAIGAISSGLSYLGPIGMGVGAALQFVNNVGAKDTIDAKKYDLGSGYGGTSLMGDKAKSADGSYSLFNRNKYKNANRFIEESNKKQNLAFNVTDEQKMRLKSNTTQELASQNLNRFSGNSGGQGFALAGKHGMKYPELEEIRLMLQNKKTPETQKFENGGKIKNVIVEGALHARKHDIESVNPELEGEITKKGIPVIAMEEGGKLQQTAEVEVGEVIFSKEVTDKIEALYADKSDEAMIELGKFLAKEIVKNTIDKTKEVL